MIDKIAEKIRSTLRLSMKIGANVWVNVAAFTPGGARPKNIENNAAEAGTLLKDVPIK